MFFCKRHVVTPEGLRLNAANQFVAVCLDDGNLMIWHQQIMVPIHGFGLEGFIDGTSVCPPKLIPTINGVRPQLTCSIAQASLPLEFWDGVYSSTVYLISMSLTPVLHGKFSFGVSCFIISLTIPCSRYLIIPIVHSPDLTINTKCSSGPFHVFSLDTIRDTTALIQLEDWTFLGMSALMETLFHVNPINLQRSIQNQLQSVEHYRIQTGKLLWSKNRWFIEE